MAAKKKKKKGKAEAETCLCTLVWDMFSSSWPTLPCRTPCVLTWHVWPCVMSRCGRVHMVYDSRFVRGASTPLSLSLPPLNPLPHSSFSTIFPLSPSPIIGCHFSPFPPDPISCYILLLSNYLYLTLPLRTAWLASFLSAFPTIKVKDGWWFHGHFLMVAWTWVKSDLGTAWQQQLLHVIAAPIDSKKDL